MSAASGRRETKRERTERMVAQRTAEQAAQRRRERMIRIGAAVAVVLVVLGVVFFMATRGGEEAPSDAALPAGVDAGGGVPVGTAESPVLEVYEDFQCPICKAFEDALGDTLAQLASSGAARVVYYPLHFLDQQLGNDSSLRAAAAAGCAQDASAFVAYHATVFANQPASEGEGFTDEQLMQFGRDAGIEGGAYDTFESCVQDRTYEGWVQQVQQGANDRPVTGTPTVFLDGKLVDITDLITGESYDPEKLRALVEGAT